MQVIGVEKFNPTVHCTLACTVGVRKMMTFTPLELANLDRVECFQLKFPTQINGENLPKPRTDPEPAFYEPPVEQLIGPVFWMIRPVKQPMVFHGELGIGFSGDVVSMVASLVDHLLHCCSYKITKDIARPA